MQNAMFLWAKDQGIQSFTDSPGSLAYQDVSWIYTPTSPRNVKVISDTQKGRMCFNSVFQSPTRVNHWQQLKILSLKLTTSFPLKNSGWKIILFLCGPRSAFGGCVIFRVFVNRKNPGADCVGGVGSPCDGICFLRGSN